MLVHSLTQMRWFGVPVLGFQAASSKVSNQSTVTSAGRHVSLKNILINYSMRLLFKQFAAPHVGE